MKAIIREKERFIKALENCSKAGKDAVTLAISAGGDKARGSLTTYDGVGLEIVCFFPVESKEQIVRVFGLNAIEVLRSISNFGSEVVLEFDEKEVKVTAGKAKSSISYRVEPAATLEVSDDKKAIAKLNLEKFKDTLARGGYAIDKSHKVLSGIAFLLTKEQLSIFSTDGRKTGKAFFGPEGVELNVEGELPLLAIPGEALNKAVSIFSSETVDMFVCNGQVTFKSGMDLAILKLISDPYPNIGAMIKRFEGAEIVVDRKELFDAISLAVSSAEGKDSTGVKISLEAGRVVVSSFDNRGIATLDKVKSLKGEFFPIKMSSIYLRSALGILEGDITLCLTNSERSALYLEDESKTRAAVIAPVV